MCLFLVFDLLFKYTKTSADNLPDIFIFFFLNKEPPITMNAVQLIRTLLRRVPYFLEVVAWHIVKNEYIWALDQFVIVNDTYEAYKEF